MMEKDVEEAREEKEAGCIVAFLMCRGVGIREGRGQLDHIFLSFSTHEPQTKLFEINNYVRIKHVNCGRDRKSVV